MGKNGANYLTKGNMPRAKRPTYTSALHDIVRQYREAGQPWPANKRTIAAWAISEGLWRPSRKSAIDELANDIGRAMGVEMITDPQGRRVRSKHARRVEIEIEGEMVQQTLWDDISTATPEHMQISFQQRRQMMLADNHQHKTDVDSYNENWNTGEALVFSYDYTEDLAELEQPTEYPESDDQDENGDEENERL
jgi:hypothetical protein